MFLLKLMGYVMVTVFMYVCTLDRNRDTRTALVVAQNTYSHSTITLRCGKIPTIQTKYKLLLIRGDACEVQRNQLNVSYQ